MKKLFYSLVLCLSAMALLISCEKTEPATSSKVKTAAVDSITATSVIIDGSVNVDISVYNDVKFGVMISKKIQELNNREGEVCTAGMLIGDDFKVKLKDLDPLTTYYYCSFVCLNGIQWEFGSIKSFQTLSSSINVSSSSIAGTKWSGVENNTDVEIVFNEDGTGRLYLEGKFNAKASITYEVTNDRFVTAYIDQIITAGDAKLNKGQSIIGDADVKKGEMTVTMKFNGSIGVFTMDKVY